MMKYGFLLSGCMMLAGCAGTASGPEYSVHENLFRERFGVSVPKDETEHRKMESVVHVRLAQQYFETKLWARESVQKHYKQANEIAKFYGFVSANDPPIELVAQVAKSADALQVPHDERDAQLLRDRILVKANAEKDPAARENILKIIEYLYGEYDPHR